MHSSQGGPFAHFSHPRKLGNQSERMIALRKQGPSGPCLSLPGSPTRGRWGLRCRWRRCDRGKSFPSTQGRNFSGPGLLKVGGPSTPCQCFNVLRVSCHLQNPTCHSWGEQFPDSVPPILVHYQNRGTTFLEDRGQLSHRTQDLFVDWRPFERRHGGDHFRTEPPWKTHTSPWLPSVFLFLRPE